MRAIHILIALPLFAAAALSAQPAAAKLLPPAEVAQANADETGARISYNNRLIAYQDCVATERVVQSYRFDLSAKPVASPCAYPGPYISPVLAAAEQRADAQTAQASSGPSDVRVSQVPQAPRTAATHAARIGG